MAFSPRAIPPSLGGGSEVLMSLPPGVYDARIDSVRMPKRGDTATVTLKVESSGETVVQSFRFDRASINTPHYIRLRRKILQHRAALLKENKAWHRMLARSLRAFYLWFPEEGESRVLLDAKLDWMSEINSSIIIDHHIQEVSTRVARREFRRFLNRLNQDEG
jgi:hypothetical protein